MGPLPTHSPSAMSPLVIEDLGLMESRFGMLATVTFFAAAAAVTAVRTGRSADRLGARTLLAVMSGGAVLAVSVVVMTGPLMPGSLTSRPGRRRRARTAVHTSRRPLRSDLLGAATRTCRPGAGGPRAVCDLP